MFCFPSPSSNLSNLLHHLATKRLLCRFRHITRKHTANGRLQPFFRDAELCALGILDVADEEGVCALGFWFFEAVFRGVLGGFAAAFWGLFFEEAVDSVELNERISECSCGMNGGMGKEIYLFFLVPLFAEILSSPCHFCPAHGVFFCGKMFLLLCFVGESQEASVSVVVD